MEALERDLDRRIDLVSWALFCLMSGVVLLAPQLPDGTWLASTGAIIVGFAALRAKVGLPVSAFWTVIGSGFAVFGVATLAGLAVPWFSASMVVCGLGLMAEMLVARPRQA